MASWLNSMLVNGTVIFYNRVLLINSSLVILMKVMRMLMHRKNETYSFQILCKIMPIVVALH